MSYYYYYLNENRYVFCNEYYDNLRYGLYNILSNVIIRTIDCYYKTRFTNFLLNLGTN